MKRQFAKLMALVLAVSMAVAAPFPAFAEGEITDATEATTKSVTEPSTGTDSAGEADPSEDDEPATDTDSDAADADSEEDDGANPDEGKAPAATDAANPNKEADAEPAVAAAGDVPAVRAENGDFLVTAEKVDEGGIAYVFAVGGNRFDADDTVELHIDAEDYYEFDRWEITPSDIVITIAPGNPDVFTFTMPASDVTVKGFFKRMTYALTLTDCTADVSGNVPFGTVVNLTAEAAPEGKRIVWKTTRPATT